MLLATQTVNVATVVAPTEKPPAPVLSSPPSGATGVSVPVTLSWSPSTGAVSYQVQVSKDAAFSQLVFDQAGITAASLIVTGLEANTQYFWRVNAANPAGASDWSSVWSFATGEKAATSPWEPMMGMVAMVMMIGMVSQMRPEEGYA